MRSYTVHAPPDDAAGDPSAAPAAIPVGAAFVKDGFSWPALFVPIIWQIWHRLWLTLVWYVVYLLVLAWIGRLAGDNAATIVGMLGALLFALEANDIRRRSLARRGWRDLGTTTGANLDEAEIRFFGAWGRKAGAPAQSRDTVRWAGDAARHDEPIFGLFPEPER